ncbi:hypothetical protein RF11_11362 [Thelohanellus kitauei]|uniref:Uncharacterized protein n=1 Tax=Thelohanellus kitauei TaxID=669202 RepID=A0A0C2J9X5_THEKT|nr:hypothetical protein RF11_11362 [Thelohanellus kitauei]
MSWNYKRTDFSRAKGIVLIIAFIHPKNSYPVNFILVNLFHFLYWKQNFPLDGFYNRNYTGSIETSRRNGFIPHNHKCYSVLYPIEVVPNCQVTKLCDGTCKIIF